MLIDLPSFHPLVYVTLAFMMGIIAQHTQLSLQIPILIFMGVGICSFYYKKYSITAFLLLLSIPCLLGMARYALYTQRYQEVFTLLSEKPTTLCGIIVDKQEPGGKVKLPRITVRLTHSDTKELDDLASHNFTLVVSTAKAYHLEVDDSIKLNSIKIKKPQSVEYQKYLTKEQCFGYLFAKTTDIKKLERPPYSLNRWLYKQRSSLLKRLQTKLSPQTFALFASLFLGNKQADSEEMESLQHQFKLWGISHYLARSGLHVTLFVALWSLIATGLLLGAYIRMLLLFFILVAYAFLSWPTLSFMRSIGMFCVACFLQYLWIRNKLTHTTTLVALAALIYNPCYCFFLDFQFTFLLTFALGWLLENNRNPKLLHVLQEHS